MKRLHLFLILIGIALLFVIYLIYYWYRICCSIPIEEEAAKLACIEACESALARGENLANGPCISNEITKNWVCDVAHSPREAVDNLPENQCSAYREGKATHFVEVDPNCNFIRAI